MPLEGAPTPALWRNRFISRLTGSVMTYPKIVVVCAVVLSVLCGWYSLRHLQLDANTDSLISPDRAFMVGYRDFMKEFGDLEYIYVAVDSRGNSTEARAAVDALTERLQRIEELPCVFGKISGDEQWRLASRAMPTDELAALAGASSGFGPLLSQRGPGSALAAADDRLSRLLGEGLSLTPAEREGLGAGAAFLLSAVTAEASSKFAFAQVLPDQYLVSSSGKIFFVEILPTKDFSGLATIEPVLRSIRQVITEVQAEFRQVDIGLTGKPVLQADELATTSEDMTRGTLVAAFLVALFTMWTFGSVVRPLLAMAALGMAFALTYGAATLLVGRLNLLSLVFMLVLVSAGVDYGIHTIARYTEFRKVLKSIPAMRHAMIANTTPTWVGACTSAVVFFVALGTEFGGLRELGIIAGVGLLLCAVTMTIALPAMVILVDGWRERRAKTEAADAGDSNEHHLAVDSFVMADPPRGSAYELLDSPKRAKRILVISGIVTILLCALIPLLRFESNLLRLQAQGLDSIEWEHRILEDSVSASWFGAVTCQSETEVQRVVVRARAQPLVEEARSLFDLVKRDDTQRTNLREKLGRALETSNPAAIPQVQETQLSAEIVARVRGHLDRLITLAALQRSADELLPLREISSALSRLETRLADPLQVSAAVADAEKSVSTSARALEQVGIGARASLREGLPAAVRDRFVSPSGTMLVSIFPKEDLWEFEPLGRFVAAMREIDPNATGVPVTVFESVVDMRSAFVLMSTWSLLIIALIVWIDLRSVVATAACLTCLLVSMAWTFGLLGVLGVSLNLANFFSVPMLLGFGIDSSVHVMHRAREQGNTQHFGWTIRAVALSAITTAVGFGTLLFAAHRGLQSLGWVMFIGSGTCLFCSVTLLPAALRVFPQLLGRAGAAPPAAGAGSGASGDTTVTV